MQNPIVQQVVEALRGANNVLITVKNSPNVDELTAAIGLTLVLNHMNKHATTVFSGEVPSTIEFLQPDMAIEQNTDSLRDFIIALDKSKADKLRYKVEDNVVRIFITPYKSSITKDDLEFSQGDFNVDVVVALGVVTKDDFDAAITAHGRILHDATVIALTHGTTVTEVGTVNWQEQTASGVSEMIATIASLLGADTIDSQVATALLSGIVAQTDRFKNEKTSPQVLTIGSQLMSAGANQQLIAEQLESHEEAPASPAPSKADPVDDVLLVQTDEPQQDTPAPDDVPDTPEQSPPSEPEPKLLEEAGTPDEAVEPPEAEASDVAPDATSRPYVTDRTHGVSPMNSNAHRASVHDEPTGMFDTHKKPSKQKADSTEPPQDEQSTSIRPLDQHSGKGFVVGSESTDDAQTPGGLPQPSGQLDELPQQLSAEQPQTTLPKSEETVPPLEEPEHVELPQPLDTNVQLPEIEQPRLLDTPEPVVAEEPPASELPASTDGGASDDGHNGIKTLSDMEQDVDSPHVSGQKELSDLNTTRQRAATDDGLEQSKLEDYLGSVEPPTDAASSSDAPKSESPLGDAPNVEVPPVLPPPVPTGEGDESLSDTPEPVDGSPPLGTPTDNLEVVQPPAEQPLSSPPANPPALSVPQPLESGGGPPIPTPAPTEPPPLPSLPQAPQAQHPQFFDADGEQHNPFVNP